MLFLIGCQDAAGSPAEASNRPQTQNGEIILPGLARSLHASVAPSTDPTQPHTFFLQATFTITNNGEAAVAADGTPLFAHAVIRHAHGESTSIDPMTVAFIKPILLAPGAQDQQTWEWPIPSTLLGTELVIEVTDVFDPKAVTTTQVVVPVPTAAN